MLCCYHKKPSPFYARLVDTQQPQQLMQAQCSARARSPCWCRAVRQRSCSQSGATTSVCFTAIAGRPQQHLSNLSAVQGNRTSISSQQQDEEHGKSHDPAASISTRKTRYAADIIRRGLNKEGWKLVITGQEMPPAGFRSSVPEAISELISACSRSLTAAKHLSVGTLTSDLLLRQSTSYGCRPQPGGWPCVHHCRQAAGQIPY